MIHGGVHDRAAQIDAFQNDPAVRVFVGQIATAGLGITLTAASTMIFYSLDYSMSNYEQTRARIHRVGQKHPCTYIHLVARGTIDEKVLKALRDKANLAKSLVDDYRSAAMFCLTTKTRANAAPGRKDELFDALRAEGYGDMITETVNANSLSSFVKEQIAENGDELPSWLHGLVNVFEKTTVGVRKAR